MRQWYSPLRYPGGKGKLFNKIKLLLDLSNISKITYVEPYAGGAGLALELLFKGVVSKIILNDFDVAIYAFWYSVLYHKDELIDLISKTPICMDEWYKQKDIQDNKEKYSNDMLKLGFSTFYLNRTNRSGIIKGGVIGGKKQNQVYKMDCRFNKQNLIERVNLIYSKRDCITLYNLKAEDLISTHFSFFNENHFVFFDPPYYKKGPGLYTNFYAHDDHISLEKLIRENVRVPYIITYDNQDEICEIYAKYKIIDFDITYSAAEHKVGSEVLIYDESYLNIPNKKIVEIFKK